MDVSFERKDKKEEWLTPPDLLGALGDFDLDPCSPINRPWSTATTHYTIEDDGLSKEWQGRVFCNPPYGRKTESWLKKCVEHGNCIALVFARTETKSFFNTVWGKADALFFIKGRVRFFTVEGVRAGSAGAPSVLIAYGKNNVEHLRNIPLAGCFVDMSLSKVIDKK